MALPVRHINHGPFVDGNILTDAGAMTDDAVLKTHALFHSHMVPQDAISQGHPRFDPGMMADDRIRAYMRAAADTGMAANQAGRSQCDAPIDYSTLVDPNPGPQLPSGKLDLDLAIQGIALRAAVF